MPRITADRGEGGGERGAGILCGDLKSLRSSRSRSKNLRSFPARKRREETVLRRPPAFCGRRVEPSSRTDVRVLPLKGYCLSLHGTCKWWVDFFRTYFPCFGAATNERVIAGSERRPGPKGRLGGPGGDRTGQRFRSGFFSFVTPQGVARKSASCLPRVTHLGDFHGRTYQFAVVGDRII